MGSNDKRLDGSDDGVVSYTHPEEKGRVGVVGTPLSLFALSLLLANSANIDLALSNSSFSARHANMYGSVSTVPSPATLDDGIAPSKNVLTDDRMSLIEIYALYSHVVAWGRVLSAAFAMAFGVKDPLPTMEREELELFLSMLVQNRRNEESWKSSIKEGMANMTDEAKASWKLSIKEGMANMTEEAKAKWKSNRSKWELGRTDEEKEAVARKHSVARIAKPGVVLREVAWKCNYDNKGNGPTCGKQFIRYYPEGQEIPLQQKCPKCLTTRATDRGATRSQKGELGLLRCMCNQCGGEEGGDSWIHREHQEEHQEE